MERPRLAHVAPYKPATDEREGNSSWVSWRRSDCSVLVAFAAAFRTAPQLPEQLNLAVGLGITALGLRNLLIHARPGTGRHGVVLGVPDITSRETPLDLAWLGVRYLGWERPGFSAGQARPLHYAGPPEPPPHIPPLRLLVL